MSARFGIPRKPQLRLPEIGEFVTDPTKGETERGSAEGKKMSGAAIQSLLDSMILVKSRADCLLNST